VASNPGVGIRSTNSISWEEFVELCILDRLSVRERIALGEFLTLLDYSMRHIILVSYGVTVADYRRDFPPGDIEVALASLLKKGCITFFPSMGSPSLALITESGRHAPLLRRGLGTHRAPA
jgi:hypothetical protein